MSTFRIRLLGALLLTIASACTPEASLDGDVFAVAIADFASSTDHCKASAPGESVLVDTTTLQAGSMTSDAQLRGEIGSENWSTAAPLLEGLRERNVAAQTLSWQAPAASGVVVTDLSSRKPDVFGRYPGTRCHLRLWLPGFSPNQKQALVRFSWGPARHGASATYLLLRTEQGWQVKWRDIAIYV